MFHAGAAGLSILASAVGAGAIVGGVWLGHRASSSDMMAITLATTLGQALSAIAIIATDRLWLAVPAVVAYGFCVSVAGIASQTLVQLASDRSMRGRVMSLYGLIFRGGPAIGALGAGIISRAAWAALADCHRRCAAGHGLALDLPDPPAHRLSPGSTAGHRRRGRARYA